jgi:hypothetical protein
LLRLALLYAKSGYGKYLERLAEEEA